MFQIGAYANAFVKKSFKTDVIGSVKGVMRMRPLEKLAIIDKIGRALQARFGYHEIDLFLAEHSIDPPKNVSANSKWVYSKEALKSVDVEKIIKIAQELDIDIPRSAQMTTSPPKYWKDTNNLRLFISHISKDKDKATRLKECLAPYAIHGFVAHEDIHPTLEWQAEIERALYAMDAFLAVHTQGFSASFWTQQEIGFAVGRGAKIISLKMGEDPTGFISKQQALARRQRAAEELAKEIDALLSEDPRTSSKLQNARRAAGLINHAIDDDIPF